MRVVREAEGFNSETRVGTHDQPTLPMVPMLKTAVHMVAIEGRVFLKLLAILVSELVKSNLFQHILPHFALTGARSDTSQITDLV